MSQSPDIALIGGGVIGLSVARQLALDGRRVVLLERGVCGAESSWAGAGIITPVNPHRGDAIARLLLRSVGLYSDWCAALREESGVDPEYERCGELQLAFDEHEASILRGNDSCGAGILPGEAGQVVSPAQVDKTINPSYEYHDRDELDRVEPAVGPEAIGGLECRLGGQVRNPRLLRALRLACVRSGVDIREGTPVTDFVVDGSRVTGVATGQETIHAGSVIVCAGAWSSEIGARLREFMPVFPVRGQIVLLKFDERPFRRVISYGSTYLVPRRDGHVLLGATDEPEAGYVKRTTPSGIAQLTSVGLRLAPVIANASVEATWAGLRPGTPNERPYIGPVPGFDGLVAATGHFRNGLTLAPVTAEIISALLAGRPYDIDLAMCAPGRA